MKKTPWFIAITIFVIAVYDVWVIMKYGNQESISAHLLSLNEVSIFFPSLLGFTFGHLTWPNRNSFLHKTSFKPYSYIFFLLMGIPAIYDFYQLYFNHGDVLIKTGIDSSIPFIVGYTLGHFFWPMNPSKWSGRFKREEK